MQIEKIRDLSLIELSSNEVLVISCDSFGGIGEKKNDALKIPLEIVGKLLIRVPLIEILCTGAKVISIVNILCNEMNPTGNILLASMKKELGLLGLNDSILNGSCEENFETTMTASGITIIGNGNRRDLKICNIYEPCNIFAIGLPKVGEEVLDENGIVTYDDILELYKMDEVLEMVPVGSKGILYECNELAKYNNKTFLKKDELKINVMKSSGPSTSVIAAVKKGYDVKLNLPINLVGEII